jgi:hypothetical protein
MAAFGAYHGLNPGMGWLFALSLGLQSQSERAIWKSMLPIAAGHALSLLVVAMIVMAGARFLPASFLEIVTALVLIGFGLYKVFNYYRHPRWVGMQVGMRDLTWWSFLMATAHGAGLMIAPLVLSLTAPAAEMHEHHTAVAGGHSAHHVAMGVSLNPEVTLGILLHTLAMLAVMALVAWFVYKKFGLRILRSHWINFDLIWAAALLLVGSIALLGSVASM